MVSITQSQRWRQQPSGATQIDRNHPLARGLVFAIVGNMPYAQEMISGNLSQPLGTSTAKTFSTGIGLYSPSNVGNGWYANYNPNVFRTIGNEFTIACEFVAESIGDSSRLVSAPWADGTFDPPKASFALRRVTTTSTMMIEIGTTSATEISATFSNAMTSDGEKATYVAVRSGSTASLRRDNILMSQISSSLTSAGNVGYSTASHVAIMNRSASSMGAGTGGGILWTYIWNRALSDQEQQEIYYKPYDIILPVDRTPFYMASFDDFTGTSTLSSTVPTVTSSGSVTSPARYEFSSEFSSEFSITPSYSGNAALTAPKSVESAAGSVTSSVRYEFSSEFSSEFNITPSYSGTSTLIGPKSVELATGSFTNPVGREFSSEFSSEFNITPSYSGTSSLIEPKDVLVASGSRTIPLRSGSSASTAPIESVTSSGSRTIPTRSGNATLRGPTSTSASAGSRTIPSRTGTAPVVSPKATLVSSGTRSVAGISGTSVLSVPIDRVATSATATIPVRSGSSVLIAQKDTTQAAGTRGIPARSGSAALIAPRQNISASQSFASSGSSSLTSPSAKSTIAASSTIPARSGSSALLARIAINTATGTRTAPGISGNSSLVAPRAKVAVIAVDASATKVGIFLSSACADLMLSALGQSLNSGFVRIYSGPEPSTAMSPLSGNTLLAELRFGATAFSAPVPTGSNRVITANLMTGDSNADNDGVATFFRAFKNDSETIIWQGSAGDSKEMILTGSGSNAYNIVKGAPVNVSSLTVTLSLF